MHMKSSRKASLLLIVAAATLSACNAAPSADSAGKDAASPSASAAAPAPSAEAAIDVVKSYYASGAKTSPGSNPPGSNPNVDPATFSPDLLKAFAAEAVKSQGEVGAIEFDIRSGSQDPAIKDLTFTSSPSETGALVVAHFVNNGQKKAVAYVLETIDGQWKISNIKSDGEAGPEAWDVKALLAAGS
jgi:predicted small secreted protein